MNRLWSAGSIVLAASLAACGTSHPECIVGASASCACPSGHMGAQLCQSNHSFGACVCVGDSDASTADVPVDTGASTDSGRDDVAADITQAMMHPTP